MLLAVTACALAAVVACARSLAPAAAAGKARALRVCLLAHAAPLSDRATGRGFDLDLMSEAAERMRVPFVPVWIENREHPTEVEEGDLPLAALTGGRCDAVPSVPGPAALRGEGDTLRLTRPYYGAAFELVGAPAPAIEALRGRTVAVQLQTVAHYALQGLGIRWTARMTPADAVAAVDAREADAALVWGPALGPLGRAPAAGWSPPQGLRWNEHVAVRRDDAALAAALDRALEALARDGALARHAQAYAIPLHAPYESASDAHALAALGIGVRGRP